MQMANSVHQSFFLDSIVTEALNEHGSSKTIGIKSSKVTFTLGIVIGLHNVNTGHGANSR